MGSRNFFAQSVILSGLLIFVLSVFCLISLAVSFVLTAMISLVYAIEFVDVFVWFGLPLTLVLSFRWLFRNIAYVKLLVRGR
ncbi:hypothetical protein N005_23325 [Pseudomonas mediterranea CFBP 5447]|nr:hypothetical protein N005_23325 [Pseudomonas mediterranea CFBP 5447]